MLPMYSPRVLWTKIVDDPRSLTLLLNRSTMRDRTKHRILYCTMMYNGHTCTEIEEMDLLQRYASGYNHFPPKCIITYTIVAVNKLSKWVQLNWCKTTDILSQIMASNTMELCDSLHLFLERGRNRKIGKKNELFIYATFYNFQVMFWVLCFNNSWDLSMTKMCGFLDLFSLSLHYKKCSQIDYSELWVALSRSERFWNELMNDPCWSFSLIGTQKTILVEGLPRCCLKDSWLLERLQRLLHLVP